MGASFVWSYDTHSIYINMILVYKHTYSFLKVAHLTRKGHAYQLTVMPLAKLQLGAFKTMCNPNEETTFEDWKDDMKPNSPTFDFWDKILHIELLVLVFVRSHREKNLALYVLEALAPWFFVLDHTNYARCLPVHIRDMKTLPWEIRDVSKKYWVFTKTRTKFSSMLID